MQTLLYNTAHSKEKIGTAANQARKPKAEFKQIQVGAVRIIGLHWTC